MTNTCVRAPFVKLQCGGLTGACFGFVDVLRNPKMLAGKRKEGTDKVVRFTARFSA